MKQILKSLFLLILFVISNSAIAESKLIQIADSQRMYSQTIAKAYIFNGMDIRPAVAKEQINEGVNELTKSIMILKAQVKEPAILVLINAVSINIEKYIQLVQQDYSMTRAKEIFDLSESILKVSDEISTELEKRETGNDIASLYISGRQRMLTQRAAKLFIAGKAGVASNIQPLVASTVDEFDKAQSILLNEPKNNRRIQRELERAGRLWETVRGYFINPGKGDLPVTIFTLSDSVADKMDKINGMYQKL